MRKKNVLIIFGGRSAEHEVSVMSARNVVLALDHDLYNPLLVGISRDGNWLPCNAQNLLANTAATSVTALHDSTDRNAIVPYDAKGTIAFTDGEKTDVIDVVFPVLHGPLGEDGTVQGLLSLSQIPFVGAEVLGSAICMDKDVSKRLLHEAGIPIARYRVCHPYDRDALNFDELVETLGSPLFVKPANAGSSVGVSKVYSSDEFTKALDKAFHFDTKVLIEEAIPGREIECAVLGNDAPRASIAGSISVNADFYSYDAKYLDPNGATLTVPADISDGMTKRVQELAIRAFQVLCCYGMARVDFFLTDDGNLFVNELNTIPGFTAISMYPKLWEQSGVGYTELITTLLELALERHAQKKRLSSHRA